MCLFNHGLFWDMILWSYNLFTRLPGNKNPREFSASHNAHLISTFENSPFKKSLPWAVVTRHKFQVHLSTGLLKLPLHNGSKLNHFYKQRFQGKYVDKTIDFGTFKDTWENSASWLYVSSTSLEKFSCVCWKTHPIYF